MIEMEHLFLSDNTIEDIAPLRRLQAVEVLRLENNSITDVSALAGLDQLRELSLARNWSLDNVQPYQTAKAEQRQFTLEDGSRLHLNIASSVEVRFNSGSREVTLTEGESMFDVAHDPSRPFMVRAGNNNVIALGTRFSVHLENGNVEVTVLEGRVAVVPLSLSFSESASLIAEQSSLIQDSSNSENTDTFILEPDRQLRIDANGQLESLLEVNAVERTSWQEGQLIFEGTPLRQVVSEISRYVPGQIRVADNVLDFPVTGVIQIRNPAAMLELLSMVVPVVPIRESATITMLYNQP